MEDEDMPMLSDDDKDIEDDDVVDDQSIDEDEDQVVPDPTIITRNKEFAAKDDLLGSSGMESGSDEEQQILSGEDSPQTPQSGKFTQDEEFTDPDDPVTVVKTSLTIDKVTQEEERVRKIKQRTLEKIDDKDERELLDKYRPELPQSAVEQELSEGEDEEEIDADLICQSMIKKIKGPKPKEDLQNQMIKVNNDQVVEPDFIYDGENTLIKVGSQRYNNFINLLANNHSTNTVKKPKHHVCLTCWQFIGFSQRPKHEELMHVVLEPSQICSEDHFLQCASEYEKLLDGTLFIMPFKNFQKGQKLKMAAAALRTGAEEKEDFDAIDTFWEDYKNQFGRHSLHVLTCHLDEKEQYDLDLQEAQRAHRARMKEAKIKNNEHNLLKKKTPLSLCEQLHLRVKRLQRQMDVLYELVSKKFNDEIAPMSVDPNLQKYYTSVSEPQSLENVKEFMKLIFEIEQENTNE